MTSYSLDDDILLCVNRAGIVGATPDGFHIRRDGSYKYSVVHCVLTGQGAVVFRNKEYHVSKGQLFVLSPGEAHEYYSDPNSPMGLCWVEFYGGNSLSITRKILSGGTVYKGEAFSAVLPLCTEIIMRLDKPEQLGEISVLLYQMLVELLRGSSYITFPEANRDGFSEILNYIDLNLDKRITINMLAERFGYNPSYLARKFAESFGTPPAKYILRQRIIRSQKLLLSTNKPLEQIAAKTGFYDASHMISKFKQFEGVTPLNYRKQNRGLIPPNE